MAEAADLEGLSAIDANSNTIGLPSKEPDFITDDELQLAKGKLELLPDVVKKKVEELDVAYNEGDLTEKGYTKKLKALVAPHLQKIQFMKTNQEKDLYEPNMNSLPKFVIEQLEEIERELEEEEITSKGYKRKREKLLAPFMLKEPPLSSLPKGVQEDIEELSKEFEEGDLTEKGYKKRRTKILTPYLIKANTWSSMVNVPPGRSNVVTVFVPSKDKQREQSDNPVGLQIINGNEKLFKCQICNEVFKQAQSFSGHCRLHRSAKSKAFKCTVCKAAYTTRSHLKFHMYKHTGNYPYNCEYCNKGFAGRSQYRYHVLRHSGQSPYICKECGGRFWKKRNLEVRCSTHRSDNAPAGFQRCAHCVAIFEDLEDLQTHMYEHDDEIQETPRSDRATMVQKGRNKKQAQQSVDITETIESEEYEEEDEEELDEHEDRSEENNCIVVSTEIVTVSSQ